MKTSSIQFFLNGRQVNRVVGSRPIVGFPGFQNWGTDVRIQETPNRADCESQTDFDQLRGTGLNESVSRER